MIITVQKFFNGRKGAFAGFAFKSDGKEAFTAVLSLQSGIYIPGNAKAYLKLISCKEGSPVIAARNNRPISVFTPFVPYQCF